MAPGKPHKEYVFDRVQAASPVELIRILYETALQAVDEALAALRCGDILARGNAITKAVELLSELRFSLRRDVHPQYCDTLAGLYDYMQRQLIRAHSEKSESMLEEVGRLIRTLLEGWSGAMCNLTAKPDLEPAGAVEEAAPVLSAPNPYSTGRTDATARSRSWQL